MTRTARVVASLLGATWLAVSCTSSMAREEAPRDESLSIPSGYLGGAVGGLVRPLQEASLHWNAWADTRVSGKPGGVRSEPLALDAEHRIFVDLARLPYELDGIAHAGAPAGLEEVLEAEADAEGKLTLSVRVLADPRSLQVTRGGDQEFDIDLATGVVDLSVAHPGLADYRKSRLGGFDFRVKPRAPGPAEVTLSIWVANRPIAEPVLKFCVVDSCSQETEALGFAPRLLGPWNTDPDAALHFIEVGPTDARKILGVLKIRGGGPLGWEIERSVAQLRKEIETDLGVTGAEVLHPEPDDAMLRRAGRALYRHLFPDDADDPQNRHESAAERASRTFQGFLEQSRRRGERASLLVRMIPMDESEPVFLPFGVMALPMDEDRTLHATVRVSVEGAVAGESDALGPVPAAASGLRESPSAASELLGLAAIVEVPLPRQRPAPRTGDCIREWNVATPIGTNDGPLQSAIDAMGAFNELAKPFTKLGDFDEKVWGRRVSRAPAAYVVTSHHHGDTLRFADDDTLSPGMIGGRFGNPSIAILNGCDTAGVGSAGIIRELDRRGVTAIVATTTTVPGRMAGRYLHCLAKQFGDGGTSLTLATAHGTAIECLRGEVDRDGHRIGSRAALYQLLGDGSALLCPARSIQADRTIEDQGDLWP